MAQVFITNIDRDGEVRAFQDHGQARLGAAGAACLLQGTFEPGWRWSKDIAPLAGTSSCQIRHLGYVVSGRMRIVTDDGDECDVSAGDLFDLPPGHDGWVLGDEPCVMVDISPDATRYASPAASTGEVDTGLDIVRRGYAAFNTGDIETLRSLFSHDVVQHVPGSGPFAGTYKGPDSVLGYYAKLAEATDGTYRAHLVDVHGDGAGHVVARHIASARRNGQVRVSPGSLLCTLLGDKVTDLLQLHSDLAGDDAFFSD